MTPPLPRRNLPLLLLQTREDVIARFRPILHAHGVTEQQWRVLRALAEDAPQPLEPRQLGAACTISSPSLTGVLARMDELDLVAQRRDGTDARRVRVTLTARGRALVRRIAPRIEREYQALEVAIGADVLRDAYALLDRLRGELRAAAAIPGTPAVPILRSRDRPKRR
ncbi:MAG: homoprotocatechuate degradation operon regulator HpaR [Betaproteobacteria bacterium]